MYFVNKSKKTAPQTEESMGRLYSIKLSALWDGFSAEPPAVWFLCVYIMLEYVRPQSIYPVIDVAPWAQIALSAACVFALFDRSIIWVKSTGNILIVVFFCTVILSSLFAFNPSYSWDKLDIVINWVILYFLIISIVNNEKRLLFFLLVFLLINFKMSQHGFISFANRGFSYAKWGVIGSPGWFHNAGDFGIAMGIFVPLSTAFCLALKSYWGYLTKIFFYLMPFTGFITIIATSSRGAQLGITGVILWFIVKSKQRYRTLAIVSALGLLAFLFTPESMIDEYKIMGDDNTSIDRIEHWKFGLDTFKTFPILGVGYENWLAYCTYKNPNGLGHRAGCRVAHNSYIQAMSELGSLGYISVILIILFIFINNYRTRKLSKVIENKFLFNIAHGLDGGLIAFMIAGFFFSVLFYPFLWVQLAFSVALHQITRNKLESVQIAINKPTGN